MMVFGRPDPKRRQSKRLPLALLPATTSGLPALSALFSPPTKSASTPLLSMKVSEVGRMKFAGRLRVSLWKLMPRLKLPKRFTLSATKKRRSERRSNLAEVGASPE